MADHSKPLTTSTYANFVAELDARFDDLVIGLDPAFTTATNIPTNSIRFNSSATKWQKWNGSAWVDLAATYAISVTGNAGTVTNGVVTTGSYSNPAFITSLAGSKISGNIAGNAGSATVLATARNINGVSFNGSANISVNLNNNVSFNNAGSGAASGVTYNGGSAITVSHNTIGAAPLNGTGASGTWGISITGNAGSVTNGVLTTGNQVIAGDKRFSDSVRIGPNDTTALYYDSGLTVRTGAAGTQRFYVFNDNGDFYVNNGNIAVSGSITANSDERLKHNWRDLCPDFLTRLAGLKTGVYDRVDSGQTQVGVGAQSLQSFLPQAVHVGADGILSVAYGNAALVACVELAREVCALRAELNEMKGA
jgi:hypothetical protein